MTKKQKVFDVINFQKTLDIPYHLDFTPPVRKMLMKYYKTDDLERAIGNYISWLSCRPALDFNGKKIDETLVQDEFGVVWYGLPENRGYVKHHPLEKPDLSGYKFPDPYTRGRFNHLQDKLEKYKDLFLLAWAGDFFERAHFLRGLNELLIDLYLNPVFVHNLLDNIMHFIVGNIIQLADLGVDGIFLSDDYGHQQSLLMSPDHWREFIKPRLKDIFAIIKSKGLLAFLHSCGNISEIIPDLVEIGLDVLHPIQPEAMDIKELKRKYGDKLAFYGGISTQKTLLSGTTDYVRQEIKKTIQNMSEGGGYILAPGITLQHDIPLENIITFIESAHEN